MHHHIVYSNPDGTVEVLGLDYFNPSSIRKLTRPGKLFKNGGDPKFIREDGTSLLLSSGGLTCTDDDLLFADDSTLVWNETTAALVARVIDRHVPCTVCYDYRNRKSPDFPAPASHTHPDFPYEVIDTRTFVWPSDNVRGDKYFKTAWRLVAGAGRMDVDMPAARLCHLGHIRAVRNAELSNLDVPWMQAVEAGDTDAQATIATEKQVLRDIPATFNITTGVDTPEKLKAKWPAELSARE